MHVSHYTKIVPIIVPNEWKIASNKNEWKGFVSHHHQFVGVKTGIWSLCLYLYLVKVCLPIANFSGSQTLCLQSQIKPEAPSLVLPATRCRYGYK